MISYTERFSILGDATRLRLLRILLEANTALCLAELVDIVRRPQYAVSRAMGTLARAGLVQVNRQGKLREYLPWPVEVDGGADDHAHEDTTADGDVTTHGTTTDHADEIRFNRILFKAVAAIPPEDCLDRHDLGRLRWRLDLREDNRCVVTYTLGYVPDEYRDKPVVQKPRVLVVCVHNSARSQIAEAYFHRFAEDLFEVESAGLVPGKINPRVIKIMGEDGFDLSVKIPRSVQDVYRSGRTFRYVITVCNPERERDCPAFPTPVERLSWPFSDPSSFTGDEEEILARIRELRDEIKDKVREFTARYRTRAGTPASNKGE